MVHPTGASTRASDGVSPEILWAEILDQVKGLRGDVTQLIRDVAVFSGQNLNGRLSDVEGDIAELNAKYGALDARVEAQDARGRPVRNLVAKGAEHAVTVFVSAAVAWLIGHHDQPPPLPAPPPAAERSR